MPLLVGSPYPVQNFLGIRQGDISHEIGVEMMSYNWRS